jgi:hypothetical protein
MTGRKEQDAGLFLNEGEVARRLGQKPGTWAATAIVLERDGLPKIDPLFGGRYWPAVRAFFDRRHGLAAGSSNGPLMPDGKENYDAL